MPSEAANRLTEAHRLAQRRLGMVTVARMRTVWPLLDPADLRSTFSPWLRAVEPIVNEQRRASSRLAAGYLSTLRTVEIGADPRFAPTLAAPVPPPALRTSMLVTGPGQIRSKLSRGYPLVRVLSESETAAAASAMRHAVNGGRDTILDTVRDDTRALGWRRVTSGDPCTFCSTLASRGAVYKTEGTVDFHAHDACLCAAAPEYRI